MDSYTYTCDCKSNPNAPVLKPVKTVDKICIHCGHYAFFGFVDHNNHVWTTPMKKARPKTVDNRRTLNEDWI